MAGTSSKRRRAPRRQPALPLPAPATPPRGADLTREKLLQATHELLVERSGEEPSLSQICARADVRAAMVSYCFGGKAQMLDALVDRAVTEIMSEQAQLIALGLPPDKALTRQVTATVRNFVRYPYMTSMSERLQAGDPSVARMAQTFVRPTLAFYRQLIDDGVDQGLFRPVDPELLLFSIVGMSEFLFAACSWLDDLGRTLDEALIERFAEHTVELLLHGILGVGAA